MKALPPRQIEFLARSRRSNVEQAMTTARSPTSGEDAADNVGGACLASHALDSATQRRPVRYTRSRKGARGAVEGATALMRPGSPSMNRFLTGMARQIRPTIPASSVSSVSTSRALTC